MYSHFNKCNRGFGDGTDTSGGHANFEGWRGASRGAAGGSSSAVGATIGRGGVGSGIGTGRRGQTGWTGPGPSSWGRGNSATGRGSGLASGRGNIGGNGPSSSSSSVEDLPESLRQFDPALVDRIMADIIDRGSPVTFDDIGAKPFYIFLSIHSHE